MSSWTGMKPTENGWYWWRHTIESTPIIVLMQAGMVYTSIAVHGRTEWRLELFQPGFWSFKLQAPLTENEMTLSLQGAKREFSSMLSTYEASNEDKR